jgi:hypothetical protein
MYDTNFKTVDKSHVSVCIIASFMTVSCTLRIVSWNWLLTLLKPVSVETSEDNNLRRIGFLILYHLHSRLRHVSIYVSFYFTTPSIPRSSKASSYAWFTIPCILGMLLSIKLSSVQCFLLCSHLFHNFK